MKLSHATHESAALARRILLLEAEVLSWKSRSSQIESALEKELDNRTSKDTIAKLENDIIKIRKESIDNITEFSRICRDEIKASDE